MKILETVETGLVSGFDRGVAAEAQAFSMLHQTAESRALVALFLAMQSASSKGAKPRDVARIAVLGAGLMGGGIADVSINNGDDVVLRDISDDALARARKSVFEGLQRRVHKGALRAFDRDRALSRLQTTASIDRISGSDLVVEAVFEDLELKREILAEVEQRVGRHTIIASNTSSLPIADIAAAAKHPERVIGMHYFSPVPKMPLLEIIATPDTPPEIIATAQAVGQRQGKTVIVVRDGPGFYTSRVLSAMLNEVLEILCEGARFEEVDAAMKDWGFPVGPVTLMDEVGLDVGANVRRGALGALFAARGVEGAPVLQNMVDAGLRGRKSGRGFYLYPAGGRKQVNEAAYRHLDGAERRDMDSDDLQQRVGLMFVNEAVRCLEEGVIKSPVDGDLGAVLGLGFPPQLGGPFRFIDEIGADEVLARLRIFEERFGARFEPAAMLVEYAQENRRFHEAVS